MFSVDLIVDKTHGTHGSPTSPHNANDASRNRRAYLLVEALPDRIQCHAPKDSLLETYWRHSNSQHKPTREGRSLEWNGVWPFVPQFRVDTDRHS
jgi:hypothetical protein